MLAMTDTATNTTNTTDQSTDPKRFRGKCSLSAAAWQCGCQLQCRLSASLTSLSAMELIEFFGRTTLVPAFTPTYRLFVVE